MSIENPKVKKQQEDEISLKELILKIREWWHYLLSKWVTIIALGLMGGVVGFTYAYFGKPIYIATTTFVLESGENSGGLGQYAGLASMVGIDLGGSGGGIFQGDNILELYKSRTMIEKTLLSPVENKSNELLVDRFISINELDKKWSNNQELLNLKIRPEIVSSKSKRLCDSLLGEFVEDINLNYLSVIKPDKKLSLIKVSVKSKDEIFAKAFNDAIVKNVNDFYIQTKTKKSLDNVTILQHKTDSVRAVMNGAIYSAVEVVDATPNLNPTRQVQRLAPAQKSQFSVETNKAILSLLIQNLELTRMALLKETPLIQVIDQPIYPLNRKQLSKIKVSGIVSAIFVFIGAFIILLKKFNNI